jgi:hypothetical protein
MIEFAEFLGIIKKGSSKSVSHLLNLPTIYRKKEVIPSQKLNQET